MAVPGFDAGQIAEVWGSSFHLHLLEQLRYGPKLAGGPAGLFLLGRDAQIFSSGNVVVRKFNGTTFGPPVTIGPGGGIRNQDLFRDAAGRLHAV